MIYIFLPRKKNRSFDDYWYGKKKQCESVEVIRFGQQTFKTLQRHLQANDINDQTCSSNKYNSMMVFAGDRQRRLDSELLREILQQEFTNHRFNNSYVEFCDQVAYCIAALLID